jgi:carboxyl-terminal processing protease
MGGRSFGKGSVQTITPLPIEGALKLTTALYYTPDGHAIQARGVIPDISIIPTEASERQREADLPGALAASEAAPKPRLGRIEESQCQAAGEKGEDRVLGCALAFLDAGSADRFLASISRPPRM